jgi:hypothetical protein
MPQQQGTHPPDPARTTGHNSNDRDDTPVVSSVSAVSAGPSPSELEAAEAAPSRIGPRPAYPTFFAMLRAEPLRTLGWLAWGGGRHAEFFRSPVRWLFGRDLLVHLRSILVYGAFGEELDHRDWMTAEPIDLSGAECEEGGFWFDYLADSGDGQLAMYDLACLLLGDLFLETPDAGAAVSVNEGKLRLPRGRFLFMGGDTAYHVADDATLEERVCTPFEWALAERGLGEWARKTLTGPLERLVFGIPGNHDYYDSLIGFNRLFRAPDNPRLAIADWQRRQSASFVALQLPFDWWFYGLDSQKGKIDRRQREFIAGSLHRNGHKRVIVATPEPATVFDAVQPEAARPFAALQLPRPFTPPSESQRPRFPAGDEIHLDLAGDVHHYARYSVNTAPNYAYVVSGGGGAFLHPTQTTQATGAATQAAVWPPRAARTYPDRDTSRCEITRRLLCPWRIFRGGGVFLIGGLCAALLYFGVFVAPGARDLFTNDIFPTLPFTSNPWQLYGWWSESPVVDSVSLVVAGDDEQSQSAAAASGMTRSTVASTRRALLPSEFAALALLLVVLAAGFASLRIFERATEPDASKRESVRAGSYSFLVATSICALGAFALMHYQRSTVTSLLPLTPLFSHVLLTLYLATFFLSLLWTIGYLGTLPKQAKVRRLSGADSIPRWTAVIFGVGTSAAGLFAYGGGSVAAFAADVVALSSAAILSLGPLLAAWLQGSGRPLPAKLGYLALGAFFGALQVTVPVVLAVHGSLFSFTAAAVWTLGLSLLALPVQRRWPSAWLLLAFWLAAGGGVVTITLWFGELEPITGVRFLVAFAAGAFFSCVWFGWYLAVALGFNAHNNEAGGAARLDAYRHFIRFKVERDAITGYVIGFDRPCQDVGLGQASMRSMARRDAGHPTLQVKLIEAFRLTPR